MEKAIVYIPVPIFSISKETGKLFGITKFNDFKIGLSGKNDSTITQPSTVSGLIYFTEKKQFKVNVEMDLMFKENKNNLKSRFTYFSFPLLFYGVGNNTIKESAKTVLYETIEFEGSWKHQVKPKHFVGIKYLYSNALTVKYFDSTEFDQGIPPSYDVTENAGLTSGSGLIYMYEGRDNRLNAFNGMYVNVEYSFYTDWLGADFEYDHLTIDIRKYFTLVDTNRLILATQFVSEFVSDGANIQGLATLGGPKGVRGVYYGRFRDYAAMQLNAELRFPLFWIIGGTVFGGMGQVAPSLGKFAFNKNHYTYGAGFRLMISSKNRVNLRLDFGFSEDENTFVLGFSEAF